MSVPFWPWKWKRTGSKKYIGSYMAAIGRTDAIVFYRRAWER